MQSASGSRVVEGVRMKTKIKDLHKAIQTMISLATGLPMNRVIKAGQGKPLPKGNSCFYKVTPVRTMGAPYKMGVPIVAIDCTIPGWEDKEETLYQKMLLNVSVHFYGDAAPDNVMSLKRCNHRHKVSRHLFASRLQWSGAGVPNDLSELVSGEIEQRFHIDINLVIDTESDSEVILMAHSIRLQMDDE